MNTQRVQKKWNKRVQIFIQIRMELQDIWPHRWANEEISLLFSFHFFIFYFFIFWYCQAGGWHGSELQWLRGLDVWEQTTRPLNA